MPPKYSVDAARFYAPGRRLLRWLDHAGFGRDHPFAYFSAPVLHGGAWVWFVIQGGPWAGGAIVIAFLFQAFVSYLAGADNLAQRDTREEVWSVIENLNTDTMGHLAILLRFYRERYRPDGAINNIEFRMAITSLQQHLLGHLIDVVAQYHYMAKKRDLSANWSIAEADEHGRWFRPIVYDRNMPDRQPSPQRRYPIADGLPGASMAFLTGELAYVHDTADPEVAPHFRPNARYRSVLSFPVNSGETVIGVVNIDARHPDQLSPRLEYLIRHFAYLIGFCESLKENAHDPPGELEPGAAARLSDPGGRVPEPVESRSGGWGGKPEQGA